ncbi:nuclear transport factor 2 family protein [Arthrobacter sp. S39]|uniref:nuclear transport factor 2 family protein n=1 Tax=Arthrobacter sp. S39 TaxID=2509720 RepID=UPI001037B96D|nr:nuclear transport factor 2 family protein [Arthrobacter sp. S39]TAP39150.1 hypothetical protein EYS21_22530 [Arthrobacter sp. S39]
MNPDQQKALMREFIAALDRNATDELAAMVAPDFRFETVSSASGESQPLDREQFLEVLPGILGTMFPDGFHYSCGEALSEGAGGSMQGTCDTVTAQGRPYVNRYHWFFAFEGDKIVRFREYLDSYAVYEAFRP